MTTPTGLKRPWELRSYNGDGLALLTGRERAFGYVHTERSPLAFRNWPRPMGMNRLRKQWRSEPTNFGIQTTPPRIMQICIVSQYIQRTGCLAVSSVERERVQECRALALLHDEETIARWQHLILDPLWHHPDDKKQISDSNLAPHGTRYVSGRWTPRSGIHQC